MKLFYTFIILLTATVTKAQFSADAGYFLALPQGKMANNINPIHQFRVGGGYTPKAAKLLTISADLGYGNYANLRLPTTFNFGNGNPTTTFVNYTSNTFQTNAGVSVDLTKKKLITPYVTLKGGFQHWYSNIYVEDPNDIDGCAPLERSNIIKDNTATVSFGGGFRYELFTNHRNQWGDKRHFIDFQVMSTRGGNLDYINTRKLKEHDHTANTNPTPSNEGKPVEMRFINVQSNVIHNHMVAEMFTTPLRLLEIKLGYHIRF